MNIKSDRFIRNTLKSNTVKYKVDAPPIDGEQSKVNMLLRNQVLNKNVNKVKINENKIESKSLKCIDFNYEQTKDDGKVLSYQYLNLLGLNDVKRTDLGAVIVNKQQKVLLAQNLKNDSPLNLLDCSSKSILAVGLQRGIYLWSQIRPIQKLKALVGTTCLQWSPFRPQLLAIGTQTGQMLIFNVQKKTQVANFNNHRQRLGTIAWLSNHNTLLSGSRNSNIYFYDIRSKQKTKSETYHRKEICSLKVCYKGTQIFASGGNDQRLMVWNPRMMRTPELIFNHSAKGIAWHPYNQGILTSGGFQDRNLRIWNCKENSLLKSMQTGSQICNLMFIKNGKYLVSSHGYNKFETNIWRYSSNGSIIKKQILVGHKDRVLYLTAFPEGDLIVTGSGDETIRFWKFNHQIQKEDQRKPLETLMSIR